MKKTKAMTLSALFAALTAAGAWIRIPAAVSSFSLQLLFTFMSAILLGKRWGAISQAIYVLLGICGLPVFTVGGGLQALLQPTGGFLPALIPTAWIIGHSIEQSGRSFSQICLACLKGLGVLYAIGLPWMHLILTVFPDRSWSMQQTLLSGMVIFLPWDLIKILLTAWLCPRLRRHLF